jgi:EAL domain-containing protein (putative c-di-GMP-specific phosphodiesterase class I)
MPAMIELVKAAGAEVAVKGVHNARDALASIEAGAAYLQGFHFGAPSRSPGNDALSARPDRLGAPPRGRLELAPGGAV